MSRRLLVLAVVLTGCAEHTSEYKELLDKYGGRTTTESSTTNSLTSGAQTSTTDSGAGTSEAGSDHSDDTGPTGDDTGQSTSDTNGATSGLPSDPPPTVTDLVCDPGKAEEVGPVACTYLPSADAIEAELLDDGEVVATGPAGLPLVFPVTSAPHNNPGSTITVVVRDAAGQTAETSIYQPSTVKDPGSVIWNKLEPHDGAYSMASAVALQDDYLIAAGTHWKNPLVVGTLRRYDKSEWTAGEGWSRTHDTWTGLEWMKAGNFSPTGLAVDAEGNILLVGVGFHDDQPRSYLARFHPDGTLHWEKPGEMGTEARAVGVQPDGTIWVAGAKRTGVNPERWDMEVSVFGPDKTPYGPFPYSDPEDKVLNKRSERGRAVAVLKNGDVVVVGEREVVDPNNPNAPWITRGVALLFEGKGKFLGDWTSTGDKLLHDAILAAVATNEGFATCGYTQAPLDEPGSKKQILIRWHGEDLQEIKAPRLESTGGAALCNALGYNMEGATIVGAQVAITGQGNDQWIFAVEDAASVRVDYREENGDDNGDDRVQALVCGYKCGWVGVETVEGAVQWIAGLFRP